jgi:uncharacterized protein (DUF2164 family)
MLPPGRTTTVLPDLTPRQKQELAARVQEYFRSERDEQIGELAAGFILEFVAELIGPYFYNDALADVRKQARARFDDLEADVLAMERPVEVERTYDDD